MPRDIGWAYYSAASRRFFTTEAGAPRQKVDTARDRANYLRDIRNDRIAKGNAPELLLREAKMLQGLNVSRVFSSMQHVEKIAERVYSINMERTTYDDVTEQLYARRKKDPSLRRLKAVATLVDLQMTNQVDELAMAQEINAVLAEDDEELQNHAKTAGAHDTGDDPMDLDEEEGGKNPLLAPLLPALEKTSVLVETPDLVIYIENETGRQTGWLSDEMRDTYRTSCAASKMLYDSSCSDPLIPADLVGLVFQLNDRDYALCETCAVPTEFDNGKHSNEGFTCCLHDDKALFKQNRKFLMYTARAMPPPSVEMDKIIYPATLQSALSESSVNTMLVREERDSANIECHFCQRIGRLAGQMASVIKRYRFLRRSKRDGSMTLDMLGICDRDARYAGAVLLQQKDGIDYDKVERAIQNARVSAMVTGYSRKRLTLPMT